MAHNEFLAKYRACLHIHTEKAFHQPRQSIKRRIEMHLKERCLYAWLHYIHYSNVSLRHMHLSKNQFCYNIFVMKINEFPWHAKNRLYMMAHREMHPTLHALLTA